MTPTEHFEITLTLIQQVNVFLEKYNKILQCALKGGVYPLFPLQIITWGQNLDLYAPITVKSLAQLVQKEA